MKDATILKIAGAIIVIGVGVILYVSRDTSKSPTWQQHSERLEELDDKMKKLMEQIKTSHGAGRCEASSQCRVIGLGQKTCGGYNNFLIYSTYDANESGLLDEVERYNAAATEFNVTSLQVPHCGVQAQTIKCVHNECVPD